MKRIILFGAALLLSTSSFSQIFSDNFDNYTIGDYLGLSNPTWDTWSGEVGTSEDVKISGDDAASGDNSIYFEAANANGGPSDVILRFEDVYTSGHFTLDFKIKVLANKGAYFNLQQNHTVGEVWALQCYLLHNGNVKFDNGSTGDILLESTYPNGEWFEMKLDIDLTTNLWEVYIDGNSIGSFSNPVNSIGIWDIFPVNPQSAGGNGQSQFFIDDVSYNHVPASLPPLNAGVTLVSPINGLAGQSIDVKTKVRNLGEDAITSFDLTYEYESQTITENITGVNLESLETYDYTFTAPITLIAGNNPLTVTVSDVNGQGQDGEVSDDSKTISILPVEPANGKIVVGEEATGTWCGWCPRGAVAMDYMAAKYDGFWAGIAVHNGDPMVVPPYDTGIGTKISGYPSALVDRGTAIDPSAAEEDFIVQILKEPKAIITNGATFDASSRELVVSLTYDFVSNISSNWKVACVLTEDGVTGSGSGYNQSNYYSGGGSGAMDGYEVLPNPVPASQMVYDHVARSIVPSFGGEAGLLPSSVTAGEEHTVCFTYTIPTEWDIDNMHIVGMLISSNGKIDNGSYSTIAEAEANGLGDCSLGIMEDNIEQGSFNVYPNPATDMAYVNLKDAQGDVVLTITDLTGKVVANRTYSSLNGAADLAINTRSLAPGTYLVTVQNKGSIEQKKLIVQ